MSDNIDIQAVQKFIEKTGYLLELKVAKKFSQLGYKSITGESYLDLEGDKYREIDVIASKKLENGVTVSFVIECKHSSQSYWIFLCHQKFVSGEALKHTPVTPGSRKVSNIRSSTIFGDLHYFDKKVSQAYNFTAGSNFNKSGKGDVSPIFEAMNRLPKSLISYAYEKKGCMNIYFPVTIFSGQIFTARYMESLELKEENHVVLPSFLNSPEYFKEPSPDWARKNSTQDKHRNAILELHKQFGSPYLIDFITENYIEAYINNIESIINALDTDEWLDGPKKLSRSD